MNLGPVQVVVVGFADEEFVGGVLPELLRLRDREAVRLIDVTFVTKDDDGLLTRMDLGDLASEERSRFGEIADLLVGFGSSYGIGLSVGAGAGTGDGGASHACDVWAISDAIPAGTSAAVALIEHRWAIPLRAAIARKGGFALEDTWLHPADLIAVGAVVSDGGQRAGSTG